MRYFSKSNYWVALITIILFIIPFFWIAPNQMDLGGDENRLFFYDPVNYIVSDGLYLFETITLGARSFEPHFYNLPFVLILSAIKSVINSPYFLISLLNGIKVSVAFLSIYLITSTIIKISFKEKRELLIHLPAIISGLLYITAPIIMGNYETALLSHNQVFLNPLCFYLLLQYFLKKQVRYLVIFIIISLIFTQSFSWTGAPTFFAFYPLSLIFLCLYVFVIQKQKIILTHIIWAIILFLGLHAFHIIPEIYNLFSSGSYINDRVFNQNNISDYLNYYYGVLPNSKLSINILLLAPFKLFSWMSFIPVLFIFLGLIFRNQKNKIIPLTGIFFLVTLYLVTANITHIGVKLYELFFYIPGFSMFRNFVGQWAFVFTFFYILLFGQTLYFVFKKIYVTKFIFIIAFIISMSIFVSGWKFFVGDMVNTVHYQSDNVRTPIVMDPKYEETLKFIRNLKDDEAFASFPFTDSYATVIHGINNGAYVGPSPITRLSGRMDYNGYTVISPFNEVFFKFAKDKNYDGIKKLLGILNVKYIYYNDDPKIYDTTFSGSPYTSSKVVLPQTQKEYKEFIKKIVAKEIYHNGTYHIYETRKDYFNPEFYIPEYLKLYNIPQSELYKQTEPFFNSTPSSDDIYITKNSCLAVFSNAKCVKSKIQLGNRPQIQFEKINPTLYRVHVKDATAGYFLVFSKSFHTRWDISLTQNNVVQDIFGQNKLLERQVLANGYANAWYILPKDVGNKTQYTLTVQMSNQKIFYLSLFITALTIICIIAYGLFKLFRK